MFNTEEKIKKLIDVGFTPEQARVLVDMIASSALTGGMFSILKGGSTEFVGSGGIRRLRIDKVNNVTVKIRKNIRKTRFYSKDLTMQDEISCPL